MRLRPTLALTGALAAAWLLATHAHAQAEPEAASGAPALRVAVGTARVPDELAPTRAALAAQVRLLLGEAGVETRAETQVLEPAAPCKQVAALVSDGTTHALLIDLRANGAGLDVVLRVYEAAGCKLAAGGRATGAAQVLGPALGTAVGRVLPKLGGMPDLLPAFSVGASELAQEGRALEALGAGELVRAWRALEGDDSLLARNLRGRIEARSMDRATSQAERIRLRAVRGQATPNDLATRQLLTEAARGLEGAPVEPRVLLAAGEIRLQRGEADGARPYLEKAAALEPNNPDAQLLRGRALALLSDAGAALAFERAAVLDPGSSRALEELAQLSAHEPARQAAVLLRAGDRAAQVLDADSAQASFARVLQLDPTRAPVVKEHAAELYGQLGDFERERASWQEAIDVGGPTPTRLVGVAHASRVVRDFNRSQAAYVQALDLLETSPDAALGLAEVYNETARSADAIAVLTHSAELSPRNAELKRGLAGALHANGQSDRALELLGAAQQLEPLDVPGLRLEATILRERGDTAGAKQRLERAIALEPVDGALRSDLAGVYDLLGDASSAQLERAHAELLTPSSASEAVAETNDGAAQEAAPLDLTGIDSNLLTLLQSFSAVEGETGRVVLILREPPPSLTEPGTWLRLHVPSPKLTASALEHALGGLYELVPRAEVARGLENPANASLVDGLFRFESEASLNGAVVAQLNQVFESDALFLARLERDPAPAADGARSCNGESPWRLELRQLSGRTLPNARILGNAICLERRGAYAGWNPYALGCYGSIVLLVLFQLVRGWGSVLVQVELPPQTRALFSISLSRRPRKVKAAVSLKNKTRAKWKIEAGLQKLNRYERPLRQGMPTRFAWIPARLRPYYVTVRGPLTNANTGELIGDFLEEQQVRVRRSKRTQVKFDLRPKETSIEISVSGLEKPAGPVAIALRGDPKSLRYVSDGPIWIFLKQGTYTMVVAHGDRLFERLFEVRSFDALRMHFDLANQNEWLFTGSKSAVTAYLECDFARAASELERSGQGKAASKIRANLLRAKAEAVAPTAEAKAPAAPPDQADAAKVFEDAGEFEDAADAYRAAGDWVAASNAYERAGELGQAIECCKQSGDQERLLALYEKNSDSFEAGELAIELKQTVRAIHAFAQVDRIDPNYRPALRKLVELHMERGQAQPALEQLNELVELEGGDEAPLPLRSVQARLLEKLGRGADALAIWESIEAMKPGFPRAAERIAELRGLHRGATQAPSAAPSGAAAPSAAPVESRYEILEELGRGAMGVVYKARDKHLGRVVALKRLTDNLRGHPTAIAYFEREARSAAVLSHPNIVIVYDAGQENGHYFMTMEHLQGTTLEQILKSRGPMTAQVAATLGIQVCAGLHYAHNNKIIHRDIKTANLFFTKDRIVKIMDFGLAKMVEEVRRGATMIGGTPYYMAPEQALGENVDHRADLYALGVTLWNLLTNGYPFEQGDVTFHHRNTPVPDPRTRVATIPAELSALVMKLMAKRREERCQSAAEVAHVLQQIATKPS